MKLSVSNIAWSGESMAEYLEILQKLGCHGVELAPSCFWDEPIESSQGERKQLSRLIKSFNLEVTGFHALLYTRQDLHFFRDRRNLAQLVHYLKQLVVLCAELDGRVLVFGSTRNRARNGRDYSECMAWAVEGFHETAEEAKRCSVMVCIEPLPQKETDFIMTSREGMHLVRTVNHENFGLHLDAKAMAESNEDYSEVFAEFGKDIQHFHVGDPGLAPPGSTGLNHKSIGAALKQSGYDGFVSIEMKNSFGNPRNVIPKSVDYVKKCYFE